jgi:predicted Rossmann-fold nucleotide-binding protein
MEAASKGHHNACENYKNPANTVGINIQLPFEQKPNRYLDVAQTVPTFSARLDTFMVLSDIFVITPGGIGTLLELFYTWQLMQVGHICRAPIILW